MERKRKQQMVRQGKKLRVVKVSRLVKKRHKLWAYSTADLAVLLNTSEGTIRYWICKKRFDPNSLISIIEFFLARQKDNA